jgi:hypothetical protein
MNQSNIWANRNEIMELCEGAAATAERTNLATESPVTETVAIGAGDSHAGSQLHQTAERTPDDEWPPCCQEAHDIGLQMGRLEAKHDADHQPAPPQPEAPEKEKP